MTFSVVLTTAIGQVRTLIPDRDLSDHFFEDEELTVLLSLEGGDVRRATALALETMASNEAYVQKAIKLLDLQTNGPAVAQSLLARALTLRAQASAAEAEEEGGAFDVAEMVFDPFSARERRRKEAWRGG
jgi:hypothetical protein